MVMLHHAEYGRIQTSSTLEMCIKRLLRKSGIQLSLKNSEVVWLGASLFLSVTIALIKCGGIDQLEYSRRHYNRDFPYLKSSSREKIVVFAQFPSQSVPRPTQSDAKALEPIFPEY